MGIETIITFVYQEILQALSQIEEAINQTLYEVEPWIIIFTTASAIFVSQWVYSSLWNDTSQNFSKKVKATFFYYVKKLPVIHGIVQKKMKAILQDVSAKKLFLLKPGMSYLHHLPHQGKKKSEILSEVNEYLSLDTVDWSQGNVSGTVYCGDSELTDVVSGVYHKFAWSYPLHFDVFPSARKMEAEVVRMSCNLFRGDPITSCGCVTAGGTESILLACKVYRDWAYANGVKKPEMICPISAHAAFEKACHYFNIKMIHICVDPITRKVDLHAMKSAISRKTCMLVGSAPQYPHGVIDPIQEIAELGSYYGIPVHVDACLGGFLLPFMKEAGYPISPFDFSVPGVTSISADTHKYGYAPKGTSIILYSSKKWIHYQYFVTPDWQGGIYGTPMFAGSRSGAVIAACWATMVFIGREGYISKTKSIINIARYIEERLRGIENIFIFGKPEVSVVAFGSHDFDILLLSTALMKRGWNLNNLQFPPSIHLCCTMLHTQTGVADKFIHDVQQCVSIILQEPSAKLTGACAMYGMAQTLPDRSIVSEVVCAILDACYDTSVSN